MAARRLSLNDIAHKVIGARGSTNFFADHPRAGNIQKAKENENQHCDGTHRDFGVSRFAGNYGQIYPTSTIMKEIARENRLVYFGEIHSKPPIVAFQYELQKAMSEESSTLHVVLEHFSFPMQGLLDDFQDGKVSFDELTKAYQQMGNEGHDLEPYRSVLEYARATEEHPNKKNIKLHAGFLPREYARMLLKEGPEVTFEKARLFLPGPTPSLVGTALHYNLFESLISGRKVTEGTPGDQMRRIFPAQVLKDVAMARKIDSLLEEIESTDKLLVIAGNGHLLHYCGVPERVNFPVDQTCLIVSMSASSTDNLDDIDQIYRHMEANSGPEGTYPADFVFVYKDSHRQQELDEVKLETLSAYDRVGESAHLKGNMKKAEAIMSLLGYTDEQYKQAGPDISNFQGVGNPHKHANIQPGDKVLDVGSGLGIDSFIANYAAGTTGRVIGIDLSSKEVHHAQRRANERDDNIQFCVADMEKLPFADETFDVVISNGAFCLAPDKEAAFREIFRVLKPGGRISICTTTVKDSLEETTEWPICMRMFIGLEEIGPLCHRVGYTDVYVDTSDSSMTMELPIEVMDEGLSNPNRNKVHVGSPEFQHLEKYDMDKLCARVCVTAKKPASHP